MIGFLVAGLALLIVVLAVRLGSRGERSGGCDRDAGAGAERAKEIATAESSFWFLDFIAISPWIRSIAAPS